MLRGKPGAEGEAGGVLLTITPPPDEHRLNAKESEIKQKGIEPKVRAWMWHGAPRFLVWNSITFSGAWLRFSEYSQVFPSIPQPSHLTRYWQCLKVRSSPVFCLFLARPRPRQVYKYPIIQRLDWTPLDWSWLKPVFYRSFSIFGTVKLLKIYLSFKLST